MYLKSKAFITTASIGLISLFLLKSVVDNWFFPILLQMVVTVGLFLPYLEFLYKKYVSSQMNSWGYTTKMFDTVFGQLPYIRDIFTETPEFDEVLKLVQRKIKYYQSSISDKDEVLMHMERMAMLYYIHEMQRGNMKLDDKLESYKKVHSSDYEFIKIYRMVG